MTYRPFRAGWTLALGAALLATTPLVTSCSQADKQEAAAETNAAYADFKAYIERAEADVQRVDFSDTEFSNELSRMQADYDAKMAAADRDIDKMTAEQKAEMEALKARYNAAYAQRKEAYSARLAETAAGTRTGTAGSAVMYQSAAAGYSTLPAADLRTTYEQFVRYVKANVDRYGIDDWRTVNADWEALNNRKEKVEDQLSADDRAEIAKEKLKYAALKTFDKTGERAAEGAAATKDGAYKTGQAIGRGANKAGHAIDKGAEKVGEAAKDVYKGVRDAVKDEEKK